MGCWHQVDPTWIIPSGVDISHYCRHLGFHHHKLLSRFAALVLCHPSTPVRENTSIWHANNPGNQAAHAWSARSLAHCPRSHSGSTETTGLELKLHRSDRGFSSTRATVGFEPPERRWGLRPMQPHRRRWGLSPHTTREHTVCVTPLFINRDHAL